MFPSFSLSLQSKTGNMVIEKRWMSIDILPGSMKDKGMIQFGPVLYVNDGRYNMLYAFYTEPIIAFNLVINGKGRMVFIHIMAVMLEEDGMTIKKRDNGEYLYGIASQKAVWEGYPEIRPMLGRTLMSGSYLSYTNNDEELMKVMVEHLKYLMMEQGHNIPKKTKTLLSMMNV